MPFSYAAAAMLMLFSAFRHAAAQLACCRRCFLLDITRCRHADITMPPAPLSRFAYALLFHADDIDAAMPDAVTLRHATLIISPLVIYASRKLDVALLMPFTPCRYAMRIRQQQTSAYDTLLMPPLICHAVSTLIFRSYVGNKRVFRCSLCHILLSYAMLSLRCLFR